MKTLTKDEFLALAKREIRATFGTYTEAAKYFGITRQALMYAIDGEGKHVPPYLLNFMGYNVVDKYTKVKK